MCFVGDRRPAVLTDCNPLTYRLTMEHHQMRKQCLSDRSADTQIHFSHVA